MVVRNERHQSLQSYAYWIFYSHSTIDYWRSTIEFTILLLLATPIKDISTHVEATTRDVSTIPVTKSMPSQEENVSGTVTA